MHEFMSRIAEAGYVEQVLLLCKQALVPFYESAGFSNLGDSGVEHGQVKKPIQFPSFPAALHFQSGNDRIPRVRIEQDTWLLMGRNMVHGMA